jgi:transcriptional regulator with XRE-family HTH domain
MAYWPTTLVESEVGSMVYPNLVWAISQLGTRYRFASGLSVSESWLSHRLTGRLRFSTEDRERIAKALGYPAEWLFAEPTPPAHKKNTAQVSI